MPKVVWRVKAFILGHLLKRDDGLAIVEQNEQPGNGLAFLLVVSVQGAHKLKGERCAESGGVSEQVLSHFAGGSRRIIGLLNEYIDRLSQLSACFKLHNVPGRLVEQAGAFLCHQDLSFRSRMWLRHSVASNTPGFLMMLVAVGTIRKRFLTCGDTL